MIVMSFIFILKGLLAVCWVWFLVGVIFWLHLMMNRVWDLN
jgi:hypothetical protein